MRVDFDWGAMMNDGFLIGFRWLSPAALQVSLVLRDLTGAPLLAVPDQLPNVTYASSYRAACSSQRMLAFNVARSLQTRLR